MTGGSHMSAIAGGRGACATGQSWAESGAGCGLTRGEHGLACAAARLSSCWLLGQAEGLAAARGKRRRGTTRLLQLGPKM
jgi:hypothetical protein